MSQLALVLVAALLAAGPAQESGAAFVRCTKCKNVGLAPCAEHEEGDCELEGNVLYCSLVAKCATCGGTGWIDCPACENGAAQERDASKRAAMPALAEELAVYEREMERPLRFAASEHFVLVCELPAMKVGRSVRKPHELLHLYVDRLERLYADYTGLLGIEDDEFPRRSEIFLWQFDQDHREAGRRFCQYSAENGVYLRGVFARYSVCAQTRFFRDDEALHRNVVHHAVHGLASLQQPSRWLGEIKAGWADAGIAHWFEDRYFEVCDNYCYQEVDQGGLRGGKWRPEIKRRFAKQDAVGLAALFDQTTQSLTEEQHPLAFALVDWLLALDPARFELLLARLRAQVPTRDALQEVYGLMPLEAEGRFEEWVLETYPAR